MTIPKPLLPVGDLPIIEVVIRQLASAGFSDVVLLLGHMAHLFVASLGDGGRWGVRIRYCYEDEPLGTAAPLRLVDGLKERFLVMNGDLLTTIDFSKLMQAQVESGAAAVIALHSREVFIDYGVVHRDEKGLLMDYVEKPVIPYEVSMGVNVLSRSAIEHIPRAGRFDMPQLMLALSKQGQKVLCFPTDCYWQDIGRFEDYQKASEDFVADPYRFLPSV